MYLAVYGYGAMMFGRLVLGEMVFTPLPRISKWIASAVPVVALDSSMAALSVHSCPIAASASHTPSPTFMSAKSEAVLTVKGAAAWAGGAPGLIIRSAASNTPEVSAF
jgi:hypothetical protein